MELKHSTKQLLLLSLACLALVSAVTIDCTSVTDSTLCGVGVCALYTWNTVNSNCQLSPLNCPSGQAWSNTACVQCSAQTSITCSTICPGYFYGTAANSTNTNNSSTSGCNSCLDSYGLGCDRCDDAQCTACITSTTF